MNVVELTAFMLILETTAMGAVWAYGSGGYEAAAGVPFVVVILVFGLCEQLGKSERRHLAKSDQDEDDPD